MEQSNLLRLKSLIALGHQVEMICLTPLGAQAPLLREAGIPAVGLEYRGRFGWRSLRSMRRAFQDHDADAIMMTGHNLAATLCLKGVRARRKVQAIYYHHLEEGKGAWKWRTNYRAANAVFDHFVFCSKYIYDEAISLSPYLKTKSTVLLSSFGLPRPTDAERKRSARIALGVPVSATVVGGAGWLIPRKRFDVFLKVASEISKRRPDAVFVVAGDGPERPALEALARQMGIADKVYFLGWRPDLTDFYSSLDLLVFNSDFDALGRVPVEAAAAGVPVVASLLKGGLSEFLRSPEEIVLFATHDVDAMARSAVDLLADADRRRTLVDAARQRIMDCGDAAHDAHRMESLLNGSE